MKISKKSKKRFAFIVTPGDLRKLTELLQGYVGAEAKLSFDLVCADETDRQLHTIDEVLAFDNARVRDIRKIKISGGTYGSTRASVTLTSYGILDDPLELDVEGMDEGRIFKLTNEVETVVEGMAPWYAIIVKARFVLAFLWAPVLGFSALGIFNQANKFFQLKEADRIGALIVVNVMMLAGAFSLMYILFKPRKLFPFVVFSLGQGKGRHDNFEVWRIAFIGGFFVNIIAGLLLMLW